MDISHIDVVLDISNSDCDISGNPLDTSSSTVDLSMDLIDYPIVLNLYVNSDMPELVEKYKSHIEKHNKKVSEDPFPDSGFDLFVPQDFW